jgi:hydrogenase maturation protease
MARVLIVAYGNPLRCDDGAARRAAEMLEGKFLSGEVEIVSLHQLGPELAESASHAECVIFIDAAAGDGKPGQVQVTRMSDGSGEPADPRPFCHALAPASIVGLAIRLYGAHLQAFSVTIKGQNFDHGESLSPAVEAALPTLIERIDELIQECRSKARDS